MKQSMTACLKKWEKMWKCYCYWYCGSLICNDNDNDYDNIFYQGKNYNKSCNLWIPCASNMLPMTQKIMGETVL